MAESKIPWTDYTYNPWWGCVKVSPGCTNCYAESVSKIFGWSATGAKGPALWGPHSARRKFTDKHWDEPLKWNRDSLTTPGRRGAGLPHMVFCGSMCDIFEDHPDVIVERLRLWDLIRSTPNLDWQLLTKRPERIAAELPADWGNGWPNVWIGCTIENNDYSHRADYLRAIPAVCRYISYEPALGNLDKLDLSGLSWVIYGGESGPRRRKDDLAWPREMRARCKDAGSAFFYQQSNDRIPDMDAKLDGETVKEFPNVRRFERRQLKWQLAA